MEGEGQMPSRSWYFEDKVKVDEDFLRTRFPETFDWLVDDQPFAQRISESLYACLQTFHDYRTEEQDGSIKGKKGRIAISWNGGKDATATLKLIQLAIEIYNDYDGKESPLSLADILGIYFSEPDAFEEVLEFTTSIAHQFQLGEFVVLDGSNIKESLRKHIEETGIEAIFMGTRKNDPNCKKVEFFLPSDDNRGWPKFMRVNPVVAWSFQEIWRFLRGTNTPYCVLYDQGYTSLGAKTNTLPNPLLRREDGTYDPAWKLQDGSTERQGRS